MACFGFTLLAKGFILNESIGIGLAVRWFVVVQAFFAVALTLVVPMLSKTKALAFVLFVVVAGLVGVSAYNYFFDLSQPGITFAGIDDCGSCCGDVQCCVSGSDEYKVGNISIWLDDKEPPIVSNFRVNAKKFEYPFVLPTRTLTQGKHQLKVEAIDKAFKKNKTVKKLDFYVDNVPLQAAFVRQESDQKVYQGRTLHVQFQVNKPISQAKVKALSGEYACVPEAPGSPIYECFIPIECEEKPNEYLLAVEVCDAVGNALNLDQKFQVVKFPFKRIRLNIDPNKVKEEKAIGIPKQELADRLVEMSSKSPKEKLWNGTFDVPAESHGHAADFGVVRISQEKGKYTHGAIDLLSPPKSVVWAPQDGVVVVKDRFDESGFTVVIDHGCSLLTLLFHLDSLADVNVGDKVKKGQRVGTVGKTGYSTGYHLHWEMRLNNKQVDPEQWIKESF